jgi:hypothetical protein
MSLHIESVLQSERQEFFCAEAAIEIAFSLIAKLSGALSNDLLIVSVVFVHRGFSEIYPWAAKNSGRLG